MRTSCGSSLHPEVILADDILPSASLPALRAFSGGGGLIVAQQGDPRGCRGVRARLEHSGYAVPTGKLGGFAEEEYLNFPPVGIGAEVQNYR